MSSNHWNTVTRLRGLVLALALLLAPLLGLAAPAHAAGNSYTIANLDDCTAFLDAIGASGAPGLGSDCTIVHGTLPAGDTLTIASGISVLIGNPLYHTGDRFDNQGTIIVNGTLTVITFATLNNSGVINGTITNRGQV